MGSQVPSERVAPDYTASDGLDAAKLVRIGGTVLDPWQSDILDDWLGRTPSGKWAAPSAGGSVPRQNGKSLLIQARSEAGMLLKSLPAKFIEWGKDMIMGLVKGITGSVGAVVGAVKNVASTIATYIHFSRPDIGPLRSYEQWMPDFMSGLAKGIRDNLWMVENAAGALALTTAQPMQLQVAGVLRGNQQTAAASWQPQPGVAYQQTNNFYTHDSLSESELTREAEDMMNRLRWGIP